MMILFLIGYDQPVTIIVTGYKNSNPLSHAMMHTVLLNIKRSSLYSILLLNSCIPAGKRIDDEETNVMHHIFQYYSLIIVVHYIM